MNVNVGLKEQAADMVAACHVQGSAQSPRPRSRPTRHAFFNILYLPPLVLFPRKFCRHPFGKLKDGRVICFWSLSDIGVVTSDHHTRCIAQERTIHPTATAAVVLDFVSIQALFDDDQRGVDWLGLQQ